MAGKNDTGACLYCDSTVTVTEYRDRHYGGQCVGSRSKAEKALREKVYKMVDEAIAERQADRREADRLERLAKSIDVTERELFITYTSRAAALRRKWEVSK